MERPDTHLTVIGAFTTSKPLWRIPELDGLAYFDDLELRVRLNEIDLSTLINILKESAIEIERYGISVIVEREFWRQFPRDCVGATIVADGHVSLRDSRDYWRITPISDPFCIQGRPKSDCEHGRSAIHAINAGGIPILSESLIRSLRELGAAGEVGDIIYKGHNKQPCDTVQPGFKRFMVKPTFELPDRFPLRYLPTGSLDASGIAATRDDSRGGERFEIALSPPMVSKVKTAHMALTFDPIFVEGGLMDLWQQRLDAECQQLQRRDT